MQTRKDDELFSSQSGDLEELQSELSRQFKSEGIDSGVISNIPSEGETVKMRGLEWKVKASYGGNRVTLELL